MKAETNNWLKPLLLSAILLRLLFCLFFFHPDIKSYQFHAQFFRQGVWDIYSYIAKNVSHLPSSDVFVYPPLAYYFLGSINAVSGVILGPDFYSWLNDWGPGGYTHPKMFEFMLVLKLPYLVLDLMLGYLLVLLIGDRKLNQKLLLFWFFNPVSLYGIYMLSQFDVLMALFTVASLILVKNHKLPQAACLLGLGAMIKSYPLLLLPFVIFRSKDKRQFALTCLAAVAGLLLPLLPVLNSSAFRFTMSQSNLMARIFQAGIEVGGGQSLPIYVVCYTLVLWFSFKRKNETDLLPEFLTTTLTVLLFAHFHAQWAIWSLPFLAVVWAKDKANLWPVYLALAIGYFFTNFLIADQFVLTGIFSSLNNHALLVPALTDTLKNFADLSLVQSTFHTLLTASGLYLIIRLWKNYGHS